MNTTKTLLALMQTMKQSASVHDWHAVQKNDAQIATVLTALTGQKLDETELNMLGKLQQAHQQILHYCQNQRDILAEKMSHAVQHREGATAYAAFMSSEELG
ncbi:hypothetical protein Z042_08660 [Chania multitudinisentens RB-25]|uniref:Flagellar protein FliT n=1 Tax=Chania multitudinisentens RB-25 TaxID=1441930 RepID=W0LCI7_9GAMM|nr:hypothetical protein [Chania multitudinisentens]AHG19685.1 hypothetical protein Z042_08660 [Chania multitudinisentens RB-25]